MRRETPPSEEKKAPVLIFGLCWFRWVLPSPFYVCVPQSPQTYVLNNTFSPLRPLSLLISMNGTTTYLGSRTRNPGILLGMPILIRSHVQLVPKSCCSHFPDIAIDPLHDSLACTSLVAVSRNGTVRGMPLIPLALVPASLTFLTATWMNFSVSEPLRSFEILVN